MNAVLTERIKQTALWSAIALLMWATQLSVFPNVWLRSLALAAALTACINLAALIVFRGTVIRWSAHLTCLGGLLASLYGRDE